MKTKDKVAEYNREYRAKNKGRIAEQTRGYRAKNKDKAAEYQRKYLAENKDKLAAHQRQKKFGISISAYEAVLDIQKGGCAICRQPCTSGRSLAVDHDHKTGRIRGLLCGRCNRGIGLLGDLPDRLRAAADYIDGSKHTHIV